jgi:hypothetical protein
MTKRPRLYSFRNPLAVIEPSGYATVAAMSSRRGVSGPIPSILTRSARAEMRGGRLMASNPVAAAVAELSKR